LIIYNLENNKIKDKKIKSLLLWWYSLLA